MFLSQLYKSTLHVKQLLSVKSIYTTACSLNAQKSPLFLLRQRTGLAYNLCRDALNKHDNNVEQAAVWLKEQALAHGLEKATKVKYRETAQGLVGMTIDSSNQFATIIELNCETDFVAKNQLFREFALDITKQISNNRSNHNSPSVDKEEKLREWILSQDDLKYVNEQIVPIITKLGENIRLSKALHIDSLCNRTKLFGEIHAKAAEDGPTSVGRFGALVALKNIAESERQTPMEPHGQRLCRHVIGFCPSYIVMPELTEEEKQELAKSGDDDPPALMDQLVVGCEDVSVKDFCAENEIEVVYFNRFECK